MATLKDYRVSVINTASNSVVYSGVFKGKSKAEVAAPFYTQLAEDYLDRNRKTLKGVSLSYLETIVGERCNYRITVDIVPGSVQCAALNREQGDKCVTVAKSRRRRRRHGKSTVERTFTVNGQRVDLSVHSSNAA